MEKNELLRQINMTYAALLQTLELFTQEQMDRVPAQDGWTAGQVAEHLIRAGESHALLFNGRTEPAMRPADAHEPLLRAIFLDFDKKLQAPAFIIPQETAHSRETQLQALENIRASLVETVNNLDLSLVCLDRVLPTLGQITRLEWIYLNIYHSQRHTRQLRHIYDALMVAAV